MVNTHQVPTEAGLTNIRVHVRTSFANLHWLLPIRMNHPLPPKPGRLPNTQQVNATPAASYFTNSGGYQSTAYNEPAQWGWYNSGVPIVAHGAQAANQQALSYPHGFNQGASTVFGVPYGPNSAGPSRPNGGRPPPGMNGVGTYGTNHCGQPGCHFRGSFKEVQTHKMDRHLIYPPGWKDKKRKPTDQDDDDAAAEEELAAKRAGWVLIYEAIVIPLIIVI